MVKLVYIVEVMGKDIDFIKVGILFIVNKKYEQEFIKEHPNAQQLSHLSADINKDIDDLLKYIRR